jgi:predicted nucleic acid-binding Zn ribbon protein
VRETKEIKTMMNINEYFKSLYNATTTEEEFEAVTAHEEEAYKLCQEAEGNEFEEWATAHGINLKAVGKYQIPELTYWCWNMEE